MSNRQRARVTYEPLRLRSTLSEGLAALPSFGDPVGETMQRGFAGLARDFSGIGDQLAAEEGQRSALSDVTDLSWRPTRAPTIRGRAYDTAGMRLFTDRMESQVRTDMQALADEHEGNPPAFLDAAAARRSEYESGFVFDEVAQPFDILWTDQAQRHVRVLSDQAEAQARQAASVAAMQRLASLENAASQQMEAIRQGHGGARDLLLGTEAQIERHYAARVADGLMSPEAAERAVQDRQRSLAVDYYVAQAQQASQTGELDGLRETLAEDYAAGALDDLDADGWGLLQRGLDAVQRAADSQAVFRTEALSRQANTVADRVALGFGDDAEIANLQREAASHPDSGEVQTRVMSQLDLANQLNAMPIPQARAHLRQLADAASNERAQAMVREGERMVNTLEREAASNPLGLAERRGLIGPVNSLFDEGIDRAQAIATRISQRDAAALGLGVSSVFFRADEVDQIRALVAENPAEAARLAGDLVGSLGEDAPVVLRELNGQAEPMMEAGMVLAAGGDPRAAADVLNGYARDANSSRLPSVPAQRRASQVTAHVAGALIDTPDDSRRIQSTAHAIARARAAQMGVDPNSDEASDLFNEALDAAAGGQVVNGERFGGFVTHDRPYWFTGNDRVLVPPTIKTDQFANVLRAVRDADLAGLANPPVDTSGQVMRASVLHGAVPVAVPGGYRFATGDPRGDDPAYIGDAQGNAFVLPLEQLTPVLRTRVPEAFR